MGCSESKSSNITVLPKGAVPEKAPPDYRKKNQYPIPVVLPPSKKEETQVDSSKELKIAPNENKTIEVEKINNQGDKDKPDKISGGLADVQIESKSKNNVAENREKDHEEDGEEDGREHKEIVEKEEQVAVTRSAFASAQNVEIIIEDTSNDKEQKQEINVDISNEDKEEFSASEPIEDKPQDEVPENPSTQSEIVEEHIKDTSTSILNEVQTEAKEEGIFVEENKFNGEETSKPKEIDDKSSDVKEDPKGTTEIEVNQIGEETSKFEEISKESSDIQDDPKETTEIKVNEREGETSKSEEISKESSDIQEDSKETTEIKINERGEEMSKSEEISKESSDIQEDPKETTEIKVNERGEETSKSEEISKESSDVQEDPKERTEIEVNEIVEETSKSEEIVKPSSDKEEDPKVNGIEQDDLKPQSDMEENLKVATEMEVNGIEEMQGEAELQSETNQSETNQSDINQSETTQTETLQTESEQPEEKSNLVKKENEVISNGFDTNELNELKGEKQVTFEDSIEKKQVEDLSDSKVNKDKIEAY